MIADECFETGIAINSLIRYEMRERWMKESRPILPILSPKIGCNDNVA